MELALLAACLLALALIKIGGALIQTILTPVASIPFAGGVVRDAENALLGWLDGISKRLTFWAARFFHGVAESCYLILGVVMLLFVAQIQLAKWLYAQVTGAFGTATVKQLVSQSHSTGTTNKAAVTALAASVVALRTQITTLERELHKATADSATAAEAAKVPAIRADLTALSKHVDAKVKALQNEITVLENVPPATAGTAGKAGEAGAPGKAGEAGRPGEAGAPGATGAAGEAGAAGAPGAAGAGIGDIDLPGLGTLTAGAAIAATYAAVTTIATEAGLTRPECRGKVKQICATDPAQWANLLGGLAALGFAFSLHDLYHEAETLVGDLAGVIKEAA